MALEVDDTLLVDLVQEQDYIYLKCKQYDNWSRTYRIQFMNRGLVYSLNGTETVIINMRQEGEEEPYVRKACEWGDDGLPRITFTSGMLQYYGLIEFDFTIIDGYSVITSRTSHIDVQKSLIYFDGLIQSEEFSILEDLIAQANEIPLLIEMFWENYNELNTLFEEMRQQLEEYEQRYQELQDLCEALIEELQQLESDLEAAEAARVEAEEGRVAAEDERVLAEEERIANEELRQEEEAARKEAFQEIVDELENVKEEVLAAGEYAEYQGDRVEILLGDLEFALIDLDCGFLDDIEVENEYDCGTL